MARGPHATVNIPRRGAMPEHVRQLWALVDEHSEWPMSGSGAHWRDVAACAGMGPTKTDTEVDDLFFPSRGVSTIPVRQICWECRVEKECALWAILTKQQMGIFGGMTKDEREEVGKLAGIWVTERQSVDQTEANLRQMRALESAPRETTLNTEAQEALEEVEAALGYPGRVRRKNRNRGRRRDVRRK